MDFLKLSCLSLLVALLSNTPSLALPKNTTILVSKAFDGSGGNGSSFPNFISGNGRYVAFSSNSTNLVENDNNNHYDVFVTDTKLGTTRRVSVSTEGIEGDGDSSVSGISDNGRYVVFTSSATNLVLDDTNSSQDAFLADLKNNTVSRISVNSSGEEGNTTSYADGISGNGRYVLFNSYATNLVSDDTNGLLDVFIKDMRTGEITLVSRERPGITSNGCYANNESISTDRHSRYILFICTNTTSPDTSTIYRYDRVKNETVLVSVDTNGDQIVGYHNRGVMSGNGRYVAFYSDIGLVAEDTNGQLDTYLRDLRRTTTTLLVTGLNRALPDQGTLIRSMSKDARYFSVTSASTNLDSLGGGNGDVFRFDRKKKTIERVSINNSSGVANDASNWGMLSTTGEYVAFYSEASDLTSDTDNGLLDVFIRRMPVAKTK